MAAMLRWMANVQPYYSGLSAEHTEHTEELMVASQICGLLTCPQNNSQLLQNKNCATLCLVSHYAKKSDNHVKNKFRPL